MQNGAKIQTSKTGILLSFCSFEQTPSLVSVGATDNFDVPAFSQFLIIFQAELLDELILDGFEFFHLHFENGNKLGGFVYGFHSLKADPEK